MNLPAEMAEVLAEPAPCDSCRFRQHCRAHELACAAFSLYINGQAQARWWAAPREPNRALFQRLLT
jgi:hypothetical protein